jgi:RNA polymerase sigma-70 factor (ECF subfamily)
MREKHRTAFVLFEIEGYTGEEIAELQGAPVATIFTRLYHARREFAAIVKQLTKERRLG